MTTVGGSVNGLLVDPEMSESMLRERSPASSSSPRLSMCFWPGLLSFLLPVHLVQVVVGFMYKDACPIDTGLPRFLLFGGLAGLMALALKVMMACAWTCANKGVNYDVRQHPGISMVRTVRYMFILFLVIWNFNETFHFFAFRPDLEHSNSEEYCHPTVYYVCVVSISVFNALVSVFVLIWLSAIIVGLCHRELLLSRGYFVSSESVFSKMAGVEDAVDSNGPQKMHRSMAKSNRLDEIMEKKETPKETLKPHNLVNMNTVSISSSSSSDSSDNKASLSIVRFAREVNSRRISADYRSDSDRLDIKRFPLGPPHTSEETEKPH